MANYGALRLLIRKAHPGIDTELVDGWMSDRYSDAILSGMAWRRREGSTIIQVPESVTAGTVTATQGSNAIVGVGTAWTTAMTGRTIRLNGLPDYYTFTYVSATTGTLDRTFESETQTAASYRIDQRLFTMPARCRDIRWVAALHAGNFEIPIITPTELQELDAQRNNYGNPFYAVKAWDDLGETDPIMRLELYPIPTCPDSMGAILSFEVYTLEDAAPLTGTTSQNLLSWVSPAAIKEGVAADCERFLKNYTGAREHETKYQEYVLSMQTTNAMQRGPVPLRLHDDYKGNPHPRYPYGPVRRGYTG